MSKLVKVIYQYEAILRIDDTHGLSDLAKTPNTVASKGLTVIKQDEKSVAISMKNTRVQCKTDDCKKNVYNHLMLCQE